MLCNCIVEWLKHATSIQGSKFHCHHHCRCVITAKTGGSEPTSSCTYNMSKSQRREKTQGKLNNTGYLERES